MHFIYIAKFLTARKTLMATTVCFNIKIHKNNIIIIIFGFFELNLLWVIILVQEAIVVSLAIERKHV